jgi:hypothetical protein
VDGIGAGTRGVSKLTRVSQEERMLDVTIEFEGEAVAAVGADLEDAIGKALRKLSALRNDRELFILARINEPPAAWEHLIEMSCRTSNSQHVFYARDLWDQYRGALEAVSAIANLRHGFAGKTKAVLEEATSYAISVAKHATRHGSRAVPVALDVTKELSGTPWSKEIDINSLMLKHSA